MVTAKAVDWPHHAQVPALPGHTQVSLPALTANSLSYHLVHRFSLSLLDVANRCAQSPISLISMTMRLASADPRSNRSHSYQMVRFIPSVDSIPRSSVSLALLSSSRLLRLRDVPSPSESAVFRGPHPSIRSPTRPLCFLCPVHTEASRDDSSQPFGHRALPPLHLAHQGTQPGFQEASSKSSSRHSWMVNKLLDE